MRTLLDTNVLIKLEDDQVLERQYSAFLREASRHSDILYHPGSLEDVKRDRDDERRGRTLSKLEKYLLLDSPPSPKDDFIAHFGGEPSPNDRVDAGLLYSVQRDAVDFLVTEDRGIHRVAQKLGLQDRVLDVFQAGDFFSRLSARQVPRHTLVQFAPVHSLNPEDPFFESLRETYDDFGDWLQKAARQGRMCWVYRPEDTIQALCIIKEEDEADSPQIPTPTLKLCTFKISNDAGGQRLGELLLKMALHYAYDNDKASTYFTVYPSQDDLIGYMEEFGFEIVDDKDDEKIMMKSMTPPTPIPSDIDPFTFAKLYYPLFYDGERVQKFIVPIRPEYHSRIFPDCMGRQAVLDEFESVISEGNTIKKAYICNAATQQINKGDLVLFYHSRERQGITCVGVVESTLRSTDPVEITRAVGNRTVYSYDEISEMAQGGALAIIFRHMSNLKEPVSPSLMAEAGIHGAPQSIRRISHAEYCRLNVEGCR